MSQLSNYREILIKIILFISLCFIISVPFFSHAGEPPSLSDPDRLTYKPLVFTPPKADRVILNNGLVLYIFEDRELPLIKVTAVVRTGSMYDPPGKEGLAEVTGYVMKTGGVVGMAGGDVDETLEQMAATLHSSIDRDTGLFSLSLLSKDLDKGLDIFSRVLMKPMFEDTKLNLAKALKIGEFRRISDQPQKLAFREFGRLMLADSLRGRLATSSSIVRIQKDDLISCHRQFYHPERVMISISGDIGRMEAEAIIDKYFGMWSSPEEKVAPPPVPHKPKGGIYVLAKEVPQSVIIFGWRAPSKRDDQFFPFEIIDFVTGNGGFRSRIFQEIRTDRGLAYSTGSFYTAKSEYGLFGAYALTKSESTLEVVSSIKRIVNDIRDKSVTSEELYRARNALLNSFIFSFTSVDKIVVQQMMIEYERLPDDYLDTYRSRINEVTVNGLQMAARDLEPDGAVVLIVGNDEIVKEISRSFEKVQKIEGSI